MFEPLSNEDASLVRKCPYEAADVLRNEGLLPLRKILSSEVASQLCQEVDEALELALQKKKHGSDSEDIKVEKDLESFGNINGCDQRHDLLLECTDTVVQACIALAHAVLPLMPMGAVVEELSCLVVDPGARSQEVHPDTPFDESEMSSTQFDLSPAPLLTCFVALQCVDVDMAPTEVLC